MKIQKTRRIMYGFGYDHVLRNIRSLIKKENKNSKMYVFGETAFSFIHHEPILQYNIYISGIDGNDVGVILHRAGFNYLRNTLTGILFVRDEYPRIPTVLHIVVGSLSPEAIVNNVCAGPHPFANIDLVVIDVDTEDIYKYENFDFDSRIMTLNNTTATDPDSNPIRFFRNSHQFNLHIGTIDMIAIKQWIENTPTTRFSIYNNEIVTSLMSYMANKIYRSMAYEKLLDRMMPKPWHNIWADAKRTPQSKATAADVLAHTMRVVKYSNPDISVRLSALLHDTGKVEVYKKHGNFHGHETVSAAIANITMRHWGFDRYPHIMVSTEACILNHMRIGFIQRKAKFTRNDLEYILKVCNHNPMDAVRAVELAIADKASTHNNARYLYPLVHLKSQFLDMQRYFNGSNTREIEAL